MTSGLRVCGCLAGCLVFCHTDLRPNRETDRHNENARRMQFQLGNTKRYKLNLETPFEGSTLVKFLGEKSEVTFDFASICN